MRIQKVQPALKLPASKCFQFAHEIAVNVVRMILVFNKRSVRKDLSHSNLPKLFNQSRKIFHKLSPPSRVPRSGTNSRSRNKRGGPELVERDRVVTCGKQAVVSESRKREHKMKVAHLT